MKFIDWFAGVGGFRRGMELAGHECVGFCEFDKFATASYTSMHLITEEQRAYLATLPLKERQKEILKEEYRNGEWYANDIRRVCADDIPKSDFWCFGFPCQDISVAGKQLGFQGNRSSLFFRVMYLIGQLKEEDKPTYLFIENVKNLLSVNGGWDFAQLLIAMDQAGYDAEWQVLNSKYFGVPQNRERCFIIGHLRGRSTAEVFPVEGANGEDSVCRIVGHRDGYRRNLQIFSPDGITETLDTGTGGGRGHHTIIALNKDYKHRHEAVLDNAGISGTVMARAYKDPQRIAVPIGIIDDQGRNQKKVVSKECAGTLRSETHGNIQDGEEAFTLTRQDRHGVAVSIEDFYQNRPVRTYDEEAPTLRSDQHGLKVAVDVEPVQMSGHNLSESFENLTVCAVWYPKKQCYIAIRKLTPKESFRLQGWTDDYFEKAEFVNSDSQLYKQAGNSVTVNVIEAIANNLNTESEN